MAIPRSFTLGWLLAAYFLFLPALPEKAEAGPFCHTERMTQAYVTQMICVESILPAQGEFIYDIFSLVDGSSTTAWCEGEPGDGIGLSISFTFEEAAPVRTLTLMNGYNKSLDHFRRNGRLKDIRLLLISYDENEEMRELRLRLKDEPLTQEIVLPWIVENPRQLIIEIVSVWPGSHYRDTCVSELAVGYGM